MGGDDASPHLVENLADSLPHDFFVDILSRESLFDHLGHTPLEVATFVPPLLLFASIDLLLLRASCCLPLAFTTAGLYSQTMISSDSNTYRLLLLLNFVKCLIYE